MRSVVGWIVGLAQIKGCDLLLLSMEQLWMEGELESQWLMRALSECVLSMCRGCEVRFSLSQG